MATTSTGLDPSQVSRAGDVDVRHLTLLTVNAYYTNNELTVYFASTGAKGLFIKNADYVHFEVGTANNTWVCHVFTLCCTLDC